MTGESNQPDPSVTVRSLRTPHSAAFAGIAFAILTLVVMVLLHTALPGDPPREPDWLITHDRQVRVAVTLMPFAVIAFLWFMGVLRDLLGFREDQFFSTIFLGSGLLFLGAVLVWVSSIAATLAAANANPTDFAESTAYAYAGSWIIVMDVVFLRMAGVFMMTSATMWLRTEALPRWLVIVTYLSAVVLLIAAPTLRPFRVAIPVWVLVVSIVILATHRRAAAGGR